MKIITSLKLLIVTLLFTLNYSGLYAQEGIIQGVITDEYGINVPGAAVMIESLNKGAVSNQDGKFTPEPPVADNLKLCGVDRVTRFTEPPKASASISGVTALFTSIV